MLALETVPLRGAGHCNWCDHYAPRGKGRQSLCDVDGTVVTKYTPVCDDAIFDRRYEAHLSYERERKDRARGHAPRAYTRTEPDTSHAERAPEPQGDRCPRCGGWLRRDGPNVVCCSCWVTITDGERVSYRRPFAESLPFLQTTRKWEH